MEAAAKEFRDDIESPTERRSFMAQARLHARGEDRSAWIDPRPETQGLEVAPWWDRARIFRLALGLMLLPVGHDDRREDLRNAIRLALQKQYDPPKPRAGAPVPGTSHAQQEARYKASPSAAEAPAAGRQLTGHKSTPTPLGAVVPAVVPADVLAVDAWLSDPRNRQKARELVRAGRRAAPKAGTVPAASRRRMLKSDLRKRVAAIIHSQTSEAA
ncbi:MAG: hypothetical protein AB1941_10035 [Gemmatimonadota bacterium]